MRIIIYKIVLWTVNSLGVRKSLVVVVAKSLCALQDQYVCTLQYRLISLAPGKMPNSSCYIQVRTDSKLRFPLKRQFCCSGGGGHCLCIAN
jgi:hypothetical protein